MIDSQTDDHPPLKLLTAAQVPPTRPRPTEGEIDRLIAVGESLRSPDLQPVGSKAQQRRAARTLAYMIADWSAANPEAGK